MESPSEVEPIVGNKLDSWQEETGNIRTKLERSISDGKRGTLAFRLSYLNRKIQDTAQSAQLS